MPFDPLDLVGGNEPFDPADPRTLPAGLSVWEDQIRAALVRVQFRTESSNYAPTVDDLGKFIRMDSATPVDVTVEAGGWPLGAMLLIRQVDAAVTIVSGVGVTVVLPEGAISSEMNGAGQEVSLHHIGDDVWEATGWFS